VNKFHKIIVQLQTCRILSSWRYGLRNFDSVQAAQELYIAILFHASKFSSWQRSCVDLLDREEEFFFPPDFAAFDPCGALNAAQEKLGA
jgi:hypothetical protein